jgi:ring-1,2-phenylacetyl-CoA epoxidase subunit PaaD
MVSATTFTIRDVYEWLEDVKDPEIPVLSLVDLGVITQVGINDGKVRVEMTPTFVGCPALEVMKSEVVEVLKGHGANEVEVTVSFRKPWSSDFISEKGKNALKQFGLAPPPSARIFTDLEILSNAVCPRCQNDNTSLKTVFGPTLCRSIHYCHTCHEAFEQFKPI